MPTGPTTSKTAVVAMVAGFVSMLIPFGVPVAIGLGIGGLIEISRSRGALVGKGFAVTGIIIGTLGIIWWAAIANIVILESFGEGYNAEVLANRGLVNAELGEYERAIEDYDQALTIDPNNANTLGNRGNAYDILGEDEQTVEDYDQALALTMSGEASYPVPDLDELRRWRDQVAPLSP